MRSFVTAGRQCRLWRNVAEPDALSAAIDDFVREYGRLDAVFAEMQGSTVFGAPVEEISPEEWNRTIAINLTGTFLTVRMLGAARANQWRHVRSSPHRLNGTRIFSNAGASDYSSSKAGQVALAKMPALELSASRIRVNVICPGAVKTSIGQNTSSAIPTRFASRWSSGKAPRYPSPAAKQRPLMKWHNSSGSSLRSRPATSPAPQVWIDGGTSLIRG